ncbi:MAG: hypothetical protein CL473_06020 [Acidobacteria bacterium]|nr:hypothetical protein [Acidobacteriota bacterium]
MTVNRSATVKYRMAFVIRLVVVVVALVMAAAPIPRSLVESAYSRGVYPIVRQVVSGLSSLTSVVLFDVLLIGGSLTLILWWGAVLMRAPRGRRIGALGSVVGHAAVVTASLYLVFLAVWGLNYRREALALRLEFSEGWVTPAVVEALAETAITKLNDAFEITPDQAWPQLVELPTTLGPAFVQVQRELEVAPVLPGLAPRRSLLTPYFQRAGIDGMVDPFSLQVLVNDAVLPFERPFVVAHEWAHVAGFAHEAEANFVAWLTCMSGEERMQYSGWFYLVPRLLAPLSRDVQIRLWDTVAPGPMADFNAVRVRLSHTIPAVRQGARRLNDQYLRANRVSSGIASYDEVLQLAVGTSLGRRQWPVSTAFE